MYSKEGKRGVNMKTKGVTNLGKKLRKIRIDNDEISSDMARKLEISVSYLSAIENGKRNIPKDLAEKLFKISPICIFQYCHQFSCIPNSIPFSSMCLISSNILTLYSLKSPIIIISPLYFIINNVYSF